MLKTKAGECTLPLLAFSLLLCLSPTVRAEEILQKGAAKYLGWVISAEKFRTCAGSELDPRGGGVQPTSRRCSKDQRLEENERRTREHLPLLPIEDDQTRVSTPVDDLLDKPVPAEDYLRYGKKAIAEAIAGPPSLSDDQLSRIKAIRAEAEKKAAPLALRLASVARQTYGNMLSDKEDASLRERLRGEMEQVVGELLSIKGQAIRDVIGVLTPFQKQLVRSEMNKPSASGDLMEVMVRIFNIP
jgi:hypothetical protein